MTEVKASNGSLVTAAPTGADYHFDHPNGSAFDGQNIWVLSEFGDTITEIDAATGAVVQRNIVGRHLPLSAPFAVAFDGSNLWITNYDGSSVTEINDSTGSLVRSLSGGSYGFDRPTGIVYDGTNIWVANQEGNTVTEISGTDGSLRAKVAVSYAPIGVAFDGEHVWVADSAGNSVSEIDTGGPGQIAIEIEFRRVLSGGAYGFDDPTAPAFDGTHIWVTNTNGNSVTDIQAT